MTRGIAVASLFAATCAAFGQSAAVPPAFEVASVKPNRSGGGRASTRISDGRLTMVNVPLKQCIEIAYDMKDYSVSGPEWLGFERFDITARPPSEARTDQARLMLRTLLAERF